MIFSSEKRFFFTLTLRMELSLFDFVQLCFGQLFFLGGHTNSHGCLPVDTRSSILRITA